MHFPVKLLLSERLWDSICMAKASWENAWILLSVLLSTWLHELEENAEVLQLWWKNSIISYFHIPIDLFSEQTTEKPLGIFPTAGKYVSSFLLKVK